MGIGVPKSTLESSPSNANSPSTRAGLLYPSVPKKTLASTRAGPPPKKPSSSSMDGGLGRDGGRRGGRGRDRNSRPSREVKLVHLLALCTGIFLAHTFGRAEWSPRLLALSRSAPPSKKTLFPIFVYGPSNQAICCLLLRRLCVGKSELLVSKSECGAKNLMLIVLQNQRFCLFLAVKTQV